MPSASRVFYLAFFSLLASSCAQRHAATRSTSGSPNICAVSSSRPWVHDGSDKVQIEPTAIVSDACASYDTLDSLNRELSPVLKDITQKTDFFSYYRLNLYNKGCQFWNDENGSCGNIACAVNTIDDEKDIPEIWRVEELSKLEGPKAQHPNRQKQEERGTKRPLQGDLGEDVGESCVLEYDDECDERDYCVPDDEDATDKGDYVSLTDNPERFTGYAGPSAHMVWDAIYRENCFSKASAPSSTNPFAPALPAVASDLRSVLQANAPSTAFSPDDSCLEKRVFYRVISGMHASISAHICHDYLNTSTGVWGPNLTCYVERLHEHPDRISNLYFNYALVTRAVAKLHPYLKDYTFCSGDAGQNVLTKTVVLHLARSAAKIPSIFDESLMFADPASSPLLKEDFRQRFRNVSRVMDCVGCDKCRLWGKLQTAGYGAALKILFEVQQDETEAPLALKRTELVALINTLGRISNSLNAIADFRRMLDSPAVAVESAPVSAVPSSSPQSSSSNRTSSGNHADADDLEDVPERTAWEEAVVELRFVLRTVLFVFRSWASLPKRLGSLFAYEASRAWAGFLGMPHGPRIDWTWQALPFGRDEL